MQDKANELQLGMRSGPGKVLTNKQRKQRLLKNTPAEVKGDVINIPDELNNPPPNLIIKNRGPG